MLLLHNLVQKEEINMYSYQKDFSFELKNDKVGERGALNIPGCYSGHRAECFGRRATTKSRQIYS